MLRVKGARVHNLKNISVEIPRNALTVVTGLSGSGKSSLAFDTIFAEGQRRYVESLSAYARQFIAQMDKPDVDEITGLSPAISIDQKTASHNPRSTVGTVTEIHDYMRLLWAKVGHVHCLQCGKELQKQSASQIVETIANLPEGTKVMLLSPLVEKRKGQHLKVLDAVRREGFVRMRIDGSVVTIDEDVELDPKVPHTIEIVIDRLVIQGMQEKEAREAREVKESKEAKEKRLQPNPNRARLADSVELALKKGNGMLIVSEVDNGKETRFCEAFVCVEHPEESIPILEPRSFSFNSPNGACRHCHGLGTVLRVDESSVIPNPNLTLAEGCIHPWASSVSRMGYMNAILEAVGKREGFSLHTRWADLSDAQKNIILHGTEVPVSVALAGRGSVQAYEVSFEGVIPNLERRHEESDSSYLRSQIEDYMEELPCPACEGKRLKREMLGVTVGGKNIVDVAEMSVDAAGRFFDGLIPSPEGKRVNQSTNKPINALTEYEYAIVKKVLSEILERLSFLEYVGLQYLTLSRGASTLSGGEAQRIRLATQIGSALQGVLYVLDEPSIGLHQRDNIRLITMLKRLRNLGNTVLVVEHDREMIAAADHIIELGPGAGKYGGEVVATGSHEDIARAKESITGQYLSGAKEIAVPRSRRKGNGHCVCIRGAKLHNLRNLTVEFPLGCFICITGVSGSGKSSLIHGTLAPAILSSIHRAHAKSQEVDAVDGIEHLDKAIVIDQSAIGRTPRSNPATYTGVFTDIRDLFSLSPEAKLRGYRPGRFSFNVKGGRCEECEGDGVKRIEMHFLPDIYVTCESCHGMRYNRETLEVTYKGKNIADVLSLTVTEALAFHSAAPHVKRKLEALEDVGLGYLHLGQSATTLSGGEAQRVKLATELMRRSTGNTLYILDEPTVGLHIDDVGRLLTMLQRLVNKGNTVLVIEHNPDVIKCADWIVDLGPEGGDGGGSIVAEGTPEDVANVKESFTGQFLKGVLGNTVPRPPRKPRVPR
jgi:excinuclease ABC subunit A